MHYNSRDALKYHLIPTRESILAFVAMLAVACLVVPPLLTTFLTAFRVPGTNLPFDTESRWGLNNVLALYTDGAIQQTLGDTLLFVFGSVLLAAVIGFGIAWLVERTDMPLRRPVLLWILIPIAMPPLISTLSWVMLLGERNGALNVLVRTIVPLWEIGPIDLFSMTGMILVQGFGLVGILYLFASASLRTFDTSLEEASAASGASTISTLRRITLPLLKPHLLGALILAIILSLESFEVPLLLALGAGRDILSTRIYFAMSDATGGAPNYGQVAALGLHFLALTYSLFYLYYRITRSRTPFAIIRGQQPSRSRVSLGRWKWFAAAATWIFLLVSTCAPVVILIWTSLLPYYLYPSIDGLASISFEQYTDLFGDARFASAAINTVIVAVIAPSISVTVGLMVAWAVDRRLVPTAVRGVLDLGTSSSIAIPGVVAANAFLLFFLRLDVGLPSWIPLLGTISVLIFAYSYRLSLAYRIQLAGIVQVSPELMDAAHVSGADGVNTLRRVVVPLIRPSTVGAWAFLAVVAVRELTLPLILSSGAPPHTISTLIWQLWEGKTGQAAALSTLSLLFIGTMLFGIRSWASRNNHLH